MTQRFDEFGYDRIGPGTEAWEACERAIWHKLHGRDVQAQECIDAMTREMVKHECTVSEIRHNEEYIAERVGEQNPDDFEMFDM